MIEAAKHAAAQIQEFMADEVISKFVENEAYEKMAEDITAKIKGSGRVNAKAAKVLITNGKNPALYERWERYVKAGYFGFFLAMY